MGAPLCGSPTSHLVIEDDSDADRIAATIPSVDKVVPVKALVKQGKFHDRALERLYSQVIVGESGLETC